MKSVWLLSGQDGRPWFMYCTRCNKVFVFVFDQDVGDVTKDRSDGRPVWLEMPRQQCHRHMSITPRKNTELLLILLVVTRHNYWMVTLFSKHFVKSVWLLSGQDGRPWFMYSCPPSWRHTHAHFGFAHRQQPLRWLQPFLKHRYVKL